MIKKKSKKTKSKKYKFEFTVDRSKWDEGGLLVKGNKPSEDTMCVLGFLGKELGISKKGLQSAGSPSGTPKRFHKKWGELGLLECHDGYVSSSDIADKIMTANDDGVDGSESKLKNLFKKLDIKVNFINKFPRDV